MAATESANTAIKNRLASMTQFHPATVNLFDGWLLDPGDVVSVAAGEETYKVPIYRMDTEWKGASRTEIQSTGSEKRPPLSELKRRSYAGGKAQSETEKELIRFDADIEKSKERILLWATEEEWDQIKQDYELTHKSELEVINSAIDARVTQYTLNQTLQGYMTVSASRAELGVLLRQGDTAVSAASLYAAINQDNSSTAGIKADKILLEGNTTLSGKVDVLGTMSVNQGALYVSTDVYASNLAGNLVVPSGGTLTFAESGNNVVVRSSTMSGLLDGVESVQISGPTNNQYKLQYHKYSDAPNVWNDAGTFSRATALIGGFGSGSQYWQSGVFKVVADPQGNTKLTSLTPTGHWGVAANDENEKKYYGNIKATIDSSPTMVETGKTFEIDASQIWMDGYNAGGGGTVVTPQLSYSWAPSGGESSTLTVTSTPTPQDPVVLTIGKGSVFWTGNTATLPITATPSGGSAAAQFNVTVDATSRYEEGWTGAWRGVRIPTAGTNTSFMFVVPSQTVNGSPVPYTYQLSKGTPSESGGYVSVSRNGTVIARISISNWWTTAYAEGYMDGEDDGWDGCYATADITAPTAGQIDYGEDARVIVKLTDKNGIVNTLLDRTYSAKMDRYPIGWADCYSKVDIPDEESTGTSFVVKTPDQTAPGQVTNTFTLTKGTPSASGGYASVHLSGAPDLLVARVSLDDWWEGGVNAAKPISSITGSWAKTGTNADGTNTLTITATSAGGGSGTNTDVKIQMASGSWNGATIPVYVNQGATRIGMTSVTAPLQAKTFTANSPSGSPYTPDSGYVGFSSVTVNVPSTAINLANVTLTPGSALAPIENDGDWYSEVNVTKQYPGATQDTDAVTVNVTTPYNNGYNSGVGNTWLYPAEEQTGDPSDGTLDPGTYYCIGHYDTSGELVYNSRRWKAPGAHPTISGHWNGNGTYTITSDVEPASGSKLTTSPTVQLSGGAGQETFRASIVSDSATPVVQTNYVDGYLVANGNTVIVYNHKEGDTYSGEIARKSISVSHAPRASIGNLDTIEPSAEGGVLFTAHSTDRGYRLLTVKCNGVQYKYKIRFVA